MMIVMIIVMNYIFFIDKYNTRDKGLNKRRVEKVGFIEVVSYIFIFIHDWEIIVALKHVKFIIYL